VLLSNERLQAVVQKPGRVMFGIGTYGGNIIDADRQRPDGEERDNFEEIIPQINVENTANYTSVVVLNDGAGGGPAIVRATGPDDLFDFVNASSVQMAGFAASPTTATCRWRSDRLHPRSPPTPSASRRRCEHRRAARHLPRRLPCGSGQVELFQPQATARAARHDALPRVELRACAGGQRPLRSSPCAGEDEAAVSPTATCT
jgi:hypothetical protein